MRNKGIHNFSCEDWSKGLNNSYIDNKSKNYPCNINIPKNNSCYLSIIGPYFDFTNIYRPTWLDQKLLSSEKEKFIQRFKHLKFSNESQMNHFGYPLTNNWRFGPDDFNTLYYYNRKDFHKEIMNNMILMDLYNRDKKKYYPNIAKPEVEVNLKNPEGKILITIHKNESLIKIREKNKTKFSKYKKKDMTIFQFFKYNSIKPYTDPNLKAAYYGAKVYGKGIHFANFFKNKGYILGRAHTNCFKESVSNSPNSKNLIHCMIIFLVILKFMEI